MTHKEQQIYHTLVMLSIFLFIIMPVQIKIFWYGLRVIVLLSIILFLKYAIRGKDRKNKDIIIFKSYFWFEILIYCIYHQYFVPNIIYLSILFIGYIIVLTTCFVYGKKIKWNNSSVFLIIESGLFVFMIFDILKVSLMS